MGIKKLGDEKYEIRIKYMGEEVRRIFRGTKAEANHALAQVQEQIAKSKSENQVWRGVAKLKGKPKSFEDIAVLYLQSLSSDKPNTIHAYGSHLKTHIVPALGRTPLRLIDQACLEKFRAGLVSTKSQSKCSRGKTLSTSTVNTIMATLYAILNFAERTGELDKVYKVKSLPEPPNDVDPLSIEELETVLTYAAPMWRPVLKLLASTGMREGELFGLRWSDVDLKKNEIRVTKQLSMNVEVKPKTASSIRTIKILPAARDAFLEIRARGIASITGRVIVGKDGKQPHPTQAYTAWSKALKAADMRHRPLHQLRHTYASLLLQSGVKPGWVSKQLGHSNIKQTFDTYIRYIPSSDSVDSSIAESVFSNTDKSTPINKESGL
jgi:integrase